MALLKIENADVYAPNPYVFDVLDARGRTSATHVLKFGEFVLVESLDNLQPVTLAEKTKRDIEAKRRADEEHAAEEQRAVRAARAFADVATQRPKTRAKTSAVAKHK